MKIVNKLIAVVCCLWINAVLFADTQSAGEQVYIKHCAVCHDNPENALARALQTLQTMIPSLVDHALTEGRMKAQGAALTDQEREDVVLFLAGSVLGNDQWEASLRCEADKTKIDNTTPTISTFGLGKKNHRYLNAKQAGLKTEDFANLKLA